MFAPVVMGSDKTTVSVATGHNEYYPLYVSLGNVQNHVRRAHRNAVALLGFLAIPKSMQTCLITQFHTNIPITQLIKSIKIAQPFENSGGNYSTHPSPTFYCLLNHGWKHHGSHYVVTATTVKLSMV